MAPNNNPRKNSEGYSDPTAFRKNGQKKWAFARFCKPKVGRKFWRHFLKTALFRPFLPVFGRFAQIWVRTIAKKPTCPLLFLI